MKKFKIMHDSRIHFPGKRREKEENVQCSFVLGCWSNEVVLVVCSWKNGCWLLHTNIYSVLYYMYIYRYTRNINTYNVVCRISFYLTWTFLSYELDE